MRGVLEGIRVIDYTQFQAGPICGMLLADMGADVIRVEPPGGASDRLAGPFAPNGESLMFLFAGRNKKSITLDLEKPAGRGLWARLIGKADVVLDNLGPQAKQNLGVTYDRLCEINPSIVYADLSAFGGDGPYRDRLGMDHIIQGEAGIMAITGFPGGPDQRFPVTFIDTTTGLYAAYAIALALMHRTRTGEGQHIEGSLFETAVSYLGFQGTLAEYELNKHVRPKLGNSSYNVFGDAFTTTDGMVMIITPNHGTFKRLMRAIGQADLLADPRFQSTATCWDNRGAITNLVKEWTKTRTCGDVIAALEGARVPCGRVNSIPDVIDNPQVKARNLFVKANVDGIGPVSHPRIPVRLSKTPAEIRHPAPKAGAHNGEIYGALLGLSRGEIEELRLQGVI